MRDPLPPESLSRREFLRLTAGSGAALTLGVNLTGCRSEPLPVPAGVAFAPDAFIRIDADGGVLVVVGRSEMGQGVSTGLPMLVAEELDADWSRVRFAFAPTHAAYANPMSYGQVTGGSTSIRSGWLPMREAGARARAMLVAAAAEEWGVAPGACRTEAGEVIHEGSGRRLGFGALASRASRMPAPGRVTLKDPRDFRLLGRSVPRLDLADHVTGRTRFGVDARPEGVLTAVVARSPVFGGTVRRVDDSRARAMPGVRHVVLIDAGVAVVADGSWPALQGRNALEIEWDEGPLASLSTQGIEAELRRLGDGAGRLAERVGAGAPGLAGAASVVEATYDLPYLAHACMEPMNCTADVRPEGVTVWAPTQAQSVPMVVGGGARGVAARTGGVPLSKVTLHTTNLGGGFGRRSEQDFVQEAVELSRIVGAPVQMVHAREDDIRHDFYRPASHHRFRAGLDGDGGVQAWFHHLVVPSIFSRFVPGFVPGFAARLAGPLKGGVDQAAVEGAVRLPYRILNREVRYTQADIGVPVGFWRSVGYSHNGFVVESFLDEVAAAANRDPVAFRLDLLPRGSRERRVLELAAEHSGWGTPPPEGTARGVAMVPSYGSYCAMVAEVGLDARVMRVRRVVAVFDCGVVLHPDAVIAQIEGGIVFGLTAALKGRISLRDGRVRESNFHDYPLLRIDEMPEVVVHLAPSGDPPGGVGECGTPPIAPAVGNALFALTGRRARRLPLSPPAP